MGADRLGLDDLQARGIPAAGLDAARDPICLVRAESPRISRDKRPAAFRRRRDALCPDGDDPGPRPSPQFGERVHLAPGRLVTGRDPLRGASPSRRGGGLGLLPAVLALRPVFSSRDPGLPPRVRRLRREKSRLGGCVLVVVPLGPLVEGGRGDVARGTGDPGCRPPPEDRSGQLDGAVGEASLAGETAVPGAERRLPGARHPGEAKRRRAALDAELRPASPRGPVVLRGRVLFGSRRSGRSACPPIIHCPGRSRGSGP